MMIIEVYDGYITREDGVVKNVRGTWDEIMGQFDCNRDRGFYVRLSAPIMEERPDKHSGAPSWFAPRKGP